MTMVTDFLVRAGMSDTGTFPRNVPDWTSSPDIVVAGNQGISRNDLITSYGSNTNRTLTIGEPNFLYLRAKNMNSTPLKQYGYLFQVPGSLVLQPEVWHKKSNLVGFDVKDPNADPSEPAITTKYARLLDAQGGQTVVTDAFTWVPDSTEHHCIVGAAAASFESMIGNYPKGNATMTDLANWIYTNGNFGWHNVDIQPLSGKLYTGSMNYAHNFPEDQVVIFQLRVYNVPVGSKISFAANNSLKSGLLIGQSGIVQPPTGGGTINDDYEISISPIVESGFSTIIYYHTEFPSDTAPANFKMELKALKTAPGITPEANSLVRAARANDSFARSFYRAHSPNALFLHPSGAQFGRGLDGFRAMMANANADDGDGGDLEEDVVVVIGSHATTPVHS
jgi:hypothetical protein